MGSTLAVQSVQTVIVPYWILKASSKIVTSWDLRWETREAIVSEEDQTWFVLMRNENWEGILNYGHMSTKGKPQAIMLILSDRLHLPKYTFSEF